MPSSKRFAKSTSAPVTVTVNPVDGILLRVTPLARHGHLNQPMSLEPTGSGFPGPTANQLHRHGCFHQPQVIPGRSCRIRCMPSLMIAEPVPRDHRFGDLDHRDRTPSRPADHGSHTFVGGVTFAESRQRNDRGQPSQRRQGPTVRRRSRSSEQCNSAAESGIVPSLSTLASQLGWVRRRRGSTDVQLDSSRGNATFNTGSGTWRT